MAFNPSFSPEQRLRKILLALDSPGAAPEIELGGMLIGLSECVARDMEVETQPSYMIFARRLWQRAAQIAADPAETAIWDSHCFEPGRAIFADASLHWWFWVLQYVTPLPPGVCDDRQCRSEADSIAEAVDKAYARLTDAELLARTSAFREDWQEACTYVRRALGWAMKAWLRRHGHEAADYWRYWETQGELRRRAPGWLVNKYVAVDLRSSAIRYEAGVVGSSRPPELDRLVSDCRQLVEFGCGFRDDLDAMAWELPVPARPGDILLYKPMGSFHSAAAFFVAAVESDTTLTGMPFDRFPDGSKHYTRFGHHFERLNADNAPRLARRLSEPDRPPIRATIFPPPPDNPLDFLPLHPDDLDLDFRGSGEHPWIWPLVKLPRPVFQDLRRHLEARFVTDFQPSDAMTTSGQGLCLLAADDVRDLVVQARREADFDRVERSFHLAAFASRPEPLLRLLPGGNVAEIVNYFFGLPEDDLPIIRHFSDIDRGRPGFSLNPAEANRQWGMGIRRLGCELPEGFEKELHSHRHGAHSTTVIGVPESDAPRNTRRFLWCRLQSGVCRILIEFHDDRLHGVQLLPFAV